MSPGNPVTVAIAFTRLHTGAIQISFRGANFGFGPIQSSHVKTKVQALRREIEAALARSPALETFSRAVVVNGVHVSDESLAAIERQHGLHLGDGDFWYDKASGAWGRRGGPTCGFIPAGLPLGGALARDASGGRTGVVINGRELHALDVLGLQRLVPMVLPGRYWVNASGDFGWEGGAALGNLWILHRRTSGGADASSGVSVGGDGQGFIYASGKDALGNYFQVTSR
jgi:hypothetical protein